MRCAESKFNKYKITDYFNDIQRYKSRIINGKHSFLLNNKFYFHLLLSYYKKNLPTIYGIIENDSVSVRTLNGDNLSLIDLISKKEKVIIKPFIGGGGKGISIIKKDNQENIFLNGNIITEYQLKKELLKYNNCIVTEFIEPGSYSKSIFPRTSNCVRITTFYIKENDEIYIPFCQQKIGTNESYPIDNWEGGGMMSPINVVNGYIGKAVYNDHNEGIVWKSFHIDTKNQIEGVKIPNWNYVISKLKIISKSIKEIPYIGWNIIIQDNDFKIIEGNNQ